MIRVDRDPEKCGRLVTDPSPKGPTVTEQVDAFKAQLERGIDTDAVDRIPADKLDDVLKILGKVR